MRFLFVLSIFGCTSFALSAQSLNERVVQVANTYAGGGYKWAGSGTPKDLIFNATKILGKSPEGTYCSGYTFTVAFDVMNEKGMFAGLDVPTMKRFQQDWYGSNDAAAETQCVIALEKLGLGKAVALADAKAGDFVQFWRNNKTGHSVIFLNWIKDAQGRITGIKYRSTQKLTDGIGERTETIGSGEKDINIERLYVARLKG